MATYADAISSIESGGRYGIVGPTHPKLGRALGKYQVMEANVGPWTKQYLGKELSADEFLASPEAQDAVFQGEFGRLAAKHGPEGAARAWFAGEGGMNDMGRKDSLGTSVADYARKFNTALGSPQGSQSPAPAPQGGILGSAPAATPEAPMGILGGMGRFANAAQQNPGFLGPPGYSESPQPQQPQQMQQAAIPPPRRRPPDLRGLQAMLAQLQPRSGGAFSWSA
jgi:hypothetical protein